MTRTDQRPLIGEHGSSETFLRYYYLKEEMVAFLRERGLPSSGSKEVLKQRISHYLDRKEYISEVKVRGKQSAKQAVITGETLLRSDFVCSEAARAFFMERLGKSFTFKVAFQRWLKSHPEATFAEACEAYKALKATPKKSEIAPQFEYNTYIRDFFAANPGRSLAEAIKCWNHKKQLPAPHTYSPTDLLALNSD